MQRRSGKKHIPLYDLRVPRQSIREVIDTLRSGWLSIGPRVAAFEKAITSLAGVKYGVAVSSATAGLITALEAAGVRGHEVITTPYSFVATVEAIIRCGAKPVFADIDPASLTLDPAAVERAVTKKTACILPVDIAGFPADYAKLRRIARAAGIPVIADASHSLGAKYRRKSVPQSCDAAVFSFHATKNLVCGEGGMVMTNRREFADRVRLISGHGLTATAYERRRTNRWSYDVTALGFKANMSEVHAAIGLGGVHDFKRNQKLRAALADRYRRNLSSLQEFVELPPEQKHIESAWHLFIIKLNLSRITIDRDEFISRMLRSGVQCGVHFQPITEFSFYRHDVNARKCPNAALAGRRVVSLPLYPTLALRDVDFVCEQAESIIRRSSR